MARYFSRCLRLVPRLRKPQLGDHTPRMPGARLSGTLGSGAVPRAVLRTGTPPELVCRLSAGQLVETGPLVAQLSERIRGVTCGSRGHKMGV